MDMLKKKRGAKNPSFFSRTFFNQKNNQFSKLLKSQFQFLILFEPDKR
jgi:hypothetical protein